VPLWGHPESIADRGGGADQRRDRDKIERRLQIEGLLLGELAESAGQEAGGKWWDRNEVEQARRNRPIDRRNRTIPPCRRNRFYSFEQTVLRTFTKRLLYVRHSFYSHE
jgi:hypothetical protein